ncbi:hypothetical protein LMG26690_05513 [Achromobacter animicus]|uniref:NAD-specific glutamate dehydrogenase n=1 Tax=Achromobacter animicus TaxID=1389935 RepID=A0A6S7AMN4_9BURK|nr:hypothetical protein LMG26690_05513 [Achromobacter animicus]
MLLRQLACRHFDDFACIDLEYGHRFGQALRLILQRACRGGGLFDQRRVLLRHFVHLRDGAVDLVNAAGLLVGGRRDLAHDVCHAFDRGDDLLHRRAGAFDLLRTGAHLGYRILDQTLDLLGGLGAALRQRAHFARHHRKALALLARTRGFHRGVQRQDVGLECDAVDHRHDFRDLARAGRNAFHGADHFRHGRTATLSDVRRAGRQLVGLARVVRVLLHGRGQLLHRRGGLFQRGGLLFGAAGQVRVARRDFTRTDVDFIHAAAHRGHGARQAFLHALDGRHQGADFVGGVDVHAYGQVACGDLVEAFAHNAQRTQHDAIHEQERAQRHHQNQHGQTDVDEGHRRGLCARRLHHLFAEIVDVGGKVRELLEEQAAGGARLRILERQVGRGVALVQGGHHAFQGVGKASESGQQVAFGLPADLGRLRNRLEGLHLLLGVRDQLLDDAGVFGGAARVACGALGSGDVGAHSGAQHLRVRVLDQIALLDAQGIQGVDRPGIGLHAVPTQDNGNERGQGDCQLGQHQAGAHLQIAKHLRSSGNRAGGALLAVST